MICSALKPLRLSLGGAQLGKLAAKWRSTLAEETRNISECLRIHSSCLRSEFGVELVMRAFMNYTFENTPELNRESAALAAMLREQPQSAPETVQRELLRDGFVLTTRNQAAVLAEAQAEKAANFRERTKLAKNVLEQRAQNREKFKDEVWFCDSGWDHPCQLDSVANCVCNA